MRSDLWTDAFLDAKRERGDPLADPVVEKLFADHDINAVNELMKGLVLNDGIPPDHLTPEMKAYLDTVAKIPLGDRAQIERGEDIFGSYGPEILMILGFYSLPAAYAAKKGVQVLYRTAYLTKRPVRRVFETTQMVIDVMARGGLEARGRGIRSAEKVRLMHAAIRHLVGKDRERPWNPEFGLPVNQEDLAGTLMTFSYVVLEGLARLGINLKPEEQEAYLYSWTVIGRIMGVDEDLIPANVDEARALTMIIRRRQVAASPEGKALTAALIEGMQSIMPSLFEGLASSMIHFFLDKDAFMGQDVAAMLGVPPANWTKHVVRAIAELGDFVHWFSEESNDAARLIRFFSRSFVDALLTVERGGNRAAFTIPASLRDLWAAKPPRIR